MTCTRARYLRTLNRWVGPYITNTRALSPSLRADTQAAGFDPFSPVACFSIPSHDAAHNAVTQ